MSIGLRGDTRPGSSKERANTQGPVEVQPQTLNLVCMMEVVLRKGDYVAFFSHDLLFKFGSGPQPEGHMPLVISGGFQKTWKVFFWGETQQT